MLCVGLGSMAAIWRRNYWCAFCANQKIDARHLSMEDLGATMPPEGADASPWCMSSAPSRARNEANGDATTTEMRQAIPWGVHCRGVSPRNAAATRRPARRNIRARRADKSASVSGSCGAESVSICSESRLKHDGAPGCDGMIRIRWRIFSLLFGFGFLAYLQAEEHHRGGRTA